MKSETKKQILTFFILFIFIGSALSFAILSAVPQSPTGDSIADSNFVHWHARLSIIINGEQILIPANVGIGSAGGHPEYIHTHSADGVMHKEGPADLTLKSFFDIWGREFNSECIFEFCNDGEKELKMYINGQKNYEFENYSFRDNDIIVIEYS